MTPQENEAILGIG